MKKIRHFAIFTENFPPCAGGGIAEWAMGVAENIGKTGEKVTVFSRWKTKPDLSLHQGKPYEIEKMAAHDWKTWRWLYSFWYSWKFLKKNPEGIIIATTWELAAPIRFLRKVYPKAQWLTIAHGLEVTKLKKASDIEAFKETIALSTAVIAVSNFTRDAILEKMANKRHDHIYFVPNGVDLNRFKHSENTRDFKRKLGIPETSKVILTLSRVIERKGHDTVIEALPKILNEFPETVYVIGGPWREDFYQKLQLLISKYKLEKQVFFTGFINDEDLNDYYSMADVYIMVSRVLKANNDSEGFGITFLEANACLTPVIGSYSGGIPDAIEDGVNGYLVQPDDKEAVADRILTIFRNPDLKKKLGISGLSRIQTGFTWEILTQRMLDLFNFHSGLPKN